MCASNFFLLKKTHEQQLADADVFTEWSRISFKGQFLWGGEGTLAVKTCLIHSYLNTSWVSTKINKKLT